LPTQEAASAHSLESFETADNEFHRRVFISTRNELLLSLDDMPLAIRSRHPMVEIRRRKFNEARRLACCGQNAAIVKALVFRDSSGAARAMRAHLTARSKTCLASHRGLPMTDQTIPANPVSGTGADLAAIMQRMTGVSPLDIMNVRMIIEPQAAAAAASNASEADVASIAEAHTKP
jgi:DNA-binding FadR family transcriptional regulator